MPDPRVEKLASILVRHSVAVKKGDTVLIGASTELAKPLVLAVYKEVMKAGAHPLTAIGFEETGNLFLRICVRGADSPIPKDQDVRGKER